MRIFLKFIILTLVAGIFTFIIYATLGKTISPSQNNQVEYQKQAIAFSEPKIKNAKAERPASYEMDRGLNEISETINPEKDEKYKVPGGINTMSTPMMRPEGWAPPLIRIPVIVPETAIKSGSCRFTIDVGKDGIPLEIKSLKCGDEIFVLPTKTAVMQWVFKPKIERGRAVPFNAGLHSTNFRVYDDTGEIIPE